MKPVKEKYSHWFPPILGATAVTIINTIFYEEAEDQISRRLRNHEMKHIEQIRELGVFGFYFQYLVQYLDGRRKGLGHWEAYEQITFEVEAREAEFPK